MNEAPARAWGEPPGRARIRVQPEDFRVEEQLGFEPEGEGEHACLWLEKTGLNTLEVQRQLARLAGVPPRDVGFSGLKDRNAVTRQWFSVGLAGREAPDWQRLDEQPGLRLLHATRHRKKIRRGVHRGNGFTLVLRELEAAREALEQRLVTVREQGVPNYFGEQRFGNNGRTLSDALAWSVNGGRRRRDQRSLMLSALRAYLFNSLLSARVQAQTWNAVLSGDTCCLRGSRSHFLPTPDEAGIDSRCEQGDLHPGLPLWGRGWREREVPPLPAELAAVGEFLEAQGLDLDWRPARVIPDDFCWQFCDDDTLQLDFRLPAGSYATAVLAECVRYRG